MPIAAPFKLARNEGVESEGIFQQFQGLFLCFWERRESYLRIAAAVKACVTVAAMKLAPFNVD